MITECRSCGAPITMNRTTRGRYMPLDREPTRDGNVQFCVVGGDEIATVLNAADQAAAVIAGIPLYLSHFVTCPNAGAHRKRG